MQLRFHFSPVPNLSHPESACATRLFFSDFTFYSYVMLSRGLCHRGDVPDALAG